MSNDALGRYRLLNELGRGAMGHVFLAHDPEIDRNVALKTIQILGALPEADRREARDRVLREARAAGKLLHPGIVTLFDVGEAEGMLYLAMEHVEGDTLDHFTKPDLLLPVGTVVEMIASVAEALEYAHHTGIVHRDVKPANLMRVEEAKAKIMDFGLACATEGQITQDGALFGTPSYMSPEQIRGGVLDGRSDLFSLAVVLYELLSGAKPFPGDSVSSIIYRIVNEPPRDISEITDRVPMSLQKFLRQALSKDPEARFPQGGAFAAALRAAGAGVSGRAAVSDPLAELDRKVVAAKVPPRSTSQRAKEARRRSSARPFVLSLVVIGALGAAGWFYRDRLPLDRIPLGFFNRQPQVVWLETNVRSEPPDLPIQVNGAPIDAAAGGIVRFAAEGEPVVVSTVQGCRRVEQTLSPSDAGGDVVLLVDSERYAGTFDPGIPGARVTLNGKSVGQAPVDLELNLCDANELEISAPGYKQASLSLPAQTRPVDVRTALAAWTVEKIPTGKLVIGDTAVKLVYYLDGKRLGTGARELELPEGRYKLRFKNEAYWIDETHTVEIAGGKTLDPELRPPALTDLVVQAFPANCKVFLRRPGGSWKYVDDTPLSRRVAVGTYEVRVTFNPTGENKERTVKLGPGDNAPVRISFSGG